VRKLIEASFVSLDGVIGDPRAWATPYFDPSAQAEALQELNGSDAMLMGRGTYEYFAPAWPALSGAYADRMNEIPKYVFSSTLERADWSNSTIIRDDPVSAVGELKQQDGNDLIMYGHGRLGQALLEHGLIDELRLAIHPLVVGEGQLLHRVGARQTTLTLVGAKTLSSGVVVLAYRDARPS
jgi:dihydrofolate reductase